MHAFPHTCSQQSLGLHLQHPGMGRGQCWDVVRGQQQPCVGPVARCPLTVSDQRETDYTSGGLHNLECEKHTSPRVFSLHVRALVSWNTYPRRCA